MPYKQHDSTLFNLPSKESKIWRYLDFIKFFNLLDTNALFFPAVHTLEDKYEGAVIIGGSPFQRMLPIPKQDVRAANQTTHPELVAINCWHISEVENYAMWKIYGGLAIQSSVSRLIEALIVERQHDIFVGEVMYNDDQHKGQLRGDLWPFIRKRTPYAFEKELRALVDLSTLGTNSSSTEEEKEYKQILNLFGTKGGIEVSVDITKLIENVYVAPGTPKWIGQSVQSLLLAKGLNCTVKSSRI